MNNNHLAVRAVKNNNQPPKPSLLVSYYHVVYTVAFCMLGIIIPLSLVKNIRPMDFLVIPLTFILANFVEYVVHRWPMHRRYPGIGLMMDLHMRHHNYFHKKNYRIKSFADYSLIVFPPLVLNAVAFGLCPLMAVAIWWSAGKNAALIFFASVMGYYLLMQIIHVLTHVREDHWIAAIPGIRYLWIHHQIHHNKKYMAKLNFNFIVPFADLIVETNAQHEP